MEYCQGAILLSMSLVAADVRRLTYYGANVRASSRRLLRFKGHKQVRMEQEASHEPQGAQEAKAARWGQARPTFPRFKGRGQVRTEQEALQELYSISL